MESSREIEAGKAQKHMAAGPTRGYAKIRRVMATAGEGSIDQRVLEDSCGWPMPLEGTTGVRKRYLQGITNPLNAASMRHDVPKTGHIVPISILNSGIDSPFSTQ